MVIISLKNLSLPQVCACPNPEPVFQKLNFVFFFFLCSKFWGERWLFVSFYIGENVVLHCLNFLFIILLFRKEKKVRISTTKHQHINCQNYISSLHFIFMSISNQILNKCLLSNTVSLIIAFITSIVANISCRFLCKIKMQYFPIFLLVFLSKYI